MSEILLSVLRMPPALFWDDNPLTRLQHDNIRREAADEIERLQSELARERQRRFDGNEQASREHRADVKALVEALECLYDAIDSSVELTPDIMRKAESALAAHRKQGD